MSLIILGSRIEEPTAHLSTIIENLRHGFTSQTDTLPMRKAIADARKALDQAEALTGWMKGATQKDWEGIERDFKKYWARRHT